MSLFISRENSWLLQKAGVKAHERIVQEVQKPKWRDYMHGKMLETPCFKTLNFSSNLDHSLAVYVVNIVYG